MDTRLSRLPQALKMVAPAAYHPPAPLPAHWTPEQALAVFECLHALREQLWAMYGPAVQQAWREQLAPQSPPPPFDPNDPF